MKPLTVYQNWKARLRLIESWQIAPTDVVLEIGSGHNPSPRADVLCERFLSDGAERHDQLPRIDRPFVVGDIFELPFADKSFDFVICAHVLEHLDDPAKAAAELSRVARRGYVETPSSVNEKLISYDFHRWYITESDGVMHFRPKLRPVHDPELAAWMGRLARVVPDFEDTFFRNLHALGNVVGIVFEDELKVSVEPKPADAAEWDVVAAEDGESEGEDAILRRAVEQARHPQGAADRIYRWITNRQRKHSRAQVDLWSRVACPACRGPLSPAEGTATCKAGHSFRVVKAGDMEIPILVAPQS